MTWNEIFEELYDRCLALYLGGNSDFETYYSADDLAFLSSIGYKPREFFDFVEDMGDGGVPVKSTALLIASARRDYFTAVQNGVKSDKEFSGNDIPAKPEEFRGIKYLPRIVAKAEAKLRGELDPNLMFSCGGDRAFLASHGDIHPADFLRNVWAADGDLDKVADFVESQEN